VVVMSHSVPKVSIYLYSADCIFTDDNAVNYASVNMT